ncbi:MAG: ion transporter [Candidatus Saccharimonadales bacterium]
MGNATRLQKLRRFLLAKEILMISLALMSLGFLVMEHIDGLSEEQLRAVEIFEVGVAILFLSEFLFEWYFARDRRYYLKYHWFYLMTAVPIPTQTFEVLHGIRLLRLVKLLQIFAHLRYERNTRLFEK